MTRTVLVQGAGGGGGNNLIRSLRESTLELRILGSNCLPHAVVKSSADESFLLPECSTEQYAPALKKLIKEEKIDLIMPNSDREVGAVSKLRNELECQIFLPEPQVIEKCQDKHLMYLCLKEADVATAPTVNINTLDDIDQAVKSLPTGDKFWIRPKVGSGSKGATWVRTPAQAKAWIQLWVDLRGYKVSDFLLSSFLPGRDYAFQSVWKDGELVVAKMCERLAYYGGATRLSGMSSSPEIARTIRDDGALETIFKAISAIADRPHGNFNLDLKADSDGNMNVTEFNIGRFCMITTIFDKTGVANTAEAYVRSAFGEDYDFGDPIDIEEDRYLIRELDTEPLVVHKSELDKYTVNKIS